ncbi:MAG: hypothetical protein QG656_2118 [Candidatus Hydrogenedentes bacterium]|nr:hypothetical protein [Candidatus Hydrogenedentota bacterium]
MRLDSDLNRIRHMIEAISQAIDYAQDRTRSELEQDVPLQHLFVRNLEIAGEAASRISPELRAAHPEIPWTRIMGMRNRLIHAYFEIDMDTVWSTVQHALPALLLQLESIENEAGE